MRIVSTHQNRTDLAKMFGTLGFKHGAEIGVRRGNYSEELCINIGSLEKLYSIDPWIVMPDDPTSRHMGEAKQERAYRQAVRRLRKYPACEIVRKTSIEAARDIPHGSLDFVYIDGSHMFDYVMVDIIEWSKRVRGGGILSGDDYKYLWFGDVVRAVNTYCEAHNIQRLNIMEPDRDDPYPVPTWWIQL
jgi:hypothetical protein